MKSTKQIFCNLVTRKATKWEPYFDVYDAYFNKFINQSPTVVEVGVWQGGSLQMWTEYFGTGATIYGIDRDPEILNNPVPHTHPVVGDQGDPEFWKSFLAQVPQIDVFVDDGGHHMFQQISTIEAVWPHLSEHGVYICEDTHTSYQPFFGGTPDGDTFMKYAKGLVDIMHRNHHGGTLSPPNSHLFGDLKCVHFYDSMVVLQKGRQKFDLVQVN
jgi:hypothetical protein